MPTRLYYQDFKKCRPIGRQKLVKTHKAEKNDLLKD
jgi:hypothetical protein